MSLEGVVGVGIEGISAFRSGTLERVGLGEELCEDLLNILSSSSEFRPSSSASRSNVGGVDGFGVRKTKDFRGFCRLEREGMEGACEAGLEDPTVTLGRDILERRELHKKKVVY